MKSLSMFASNEALSREEMKHVTGGVRPPSVTCDYINTDGPGNSQGCDLTLEQCQQLADDTCSLLDTCLDASCKID